MVHNGTTRTRLDRVAHFDLGPNWFRQVRQSLHRGDIWLRILMAVFAGAIMWGVNRSWEPRFPYQLSQVPARDIVARVSFAKVDPVKTRELKNRARRSVECVYRNDPQLLVQLRSSLKGKLFQILQAKSLDEVRETWDALNLPTESKADSGASGAATIAPAEAPTPVAAADGHADVAQLDEPPPAAPIDSLAGFQAAFANDPQLEQFDSQLAKAFAEIERYGLLTELQHDSTEGSVAELTIINPGEEKPLPRVPIEQVRFAEATHRLSEHLKKELLVPGLAESIQAWLLPQLSSTLALDRDATDEATRKLLEQTEDVMVRYTAGQDVLAAAEKPISSSEMQLLRLEHETRLRESTITELVTRSLASAGMYIALFILCGTYLSYREPNLLINLRRYATLLTLMVVTIAAAHFCSQDPWQIELIPIMMFGVTVGIAYRQEVAFLLLAAIALMATLVLGKDNAHFVVYAATLASSVFLVANVRSRTKLLYVGFWAACVAILTTLGVESIGDGVLGYHLVQDALWNGLLAVAAGMLMTAMLPFVESVMEVQTDISLLELGDVAHPLLQELAQRAPGTYNHSMTVASIAQTAAESIGANGLLVRVGAYFHDIGKMLKPQYFIENQQHGASRHDSLLPAMSTLIIIAHVKDGADLARKHHLPKPIIDFIVQHHGTTIVEYFFDRANKQQEGKVDPVEIDEQSFRYPGPKPQTREAAVLMLADATESASRSLQDPAPARIEGLVQEIAEKRLLDGQFDECGLTLQDLRTVEISIIKSLMAMYHGRVRYPDQQSA